jgi:hypothetical protein
VTHLVSSKIVSFLYNDSIQFIFKGLKTLVQKVWAHRKFENRPLGPTTIRLLPYCR